MPKIETSADPQTAYKRIKEYFETHDPLGQLPMPVSTLFDDSELSLKAAGKGLQGLLRAEDGGIYYELELSFLLRPFQSKIEGIIKKTVEAAFNEEG